MTTNAKTLKSTFGLLLGALALAACEPNLAELRPVDQGFRYLHPYPQPKPGRSPQFAALNGKTTYVEVAPSIYDKSDPFNDPPGSNFLNTVDSNVFDSFGRELPNTLPSTPSNPYNLQDGPVVVTPIDPRSPTSDLRALFRRINAAAVADRIDREAFQEAIDILEGNRVFPERHYNGFPLLHYKGPTKIKKVSPVYDESGDLVGGNVNIHQIWYDSHIESDTAFLDPSDVFDVPWTITYTVDVLEAGDDDFSPFVMYVDDPFASVQGSPPQPLVAMDQTFYPMKEGTRNVFKIKMSRGKYYNLSYHWGWRIHPPRIQVTENARKVINGRRLPAYSSMVFGDVPTANRKTKLAAIAKLGNLAPAKRMWNAFNAALLSESSQEVLALMEEAEGAFDDWQDRNSLPAGVDPDPDADLTLFYANNTIYGEMKGGGIPQLTSWTTRPAKVTVALINGDYFIHGYQNVDFGGNRGWENQFQSTLASGGSGPFFTFGRTWWWTNAGGPWGLIDVPAAEGDNLGRHKVVMNFDFEPSRRLRMYQFDPYHHDVAIWSVH